MDIVEEIRGRLFALRDTEYRDFMRPLLPTIDAARVIGVRTPALRSLARELGGSETAETFLAVLPHRYFEENQLHAFLISELRNYRAAVEATDVFLPYVDNWATCDQLSPRVFGRRREALLDEIGRWTASEHVYTVRFGVGMLLRHYLDEAFRPEHPRLVAELRSGEYYLDMMRAWYFATAIAKQPDAALPYLERRELDVRTHNKAIQKAIESCRVPEKTKQYLRTLRISGKQFREKMAKNREKS